MKKWNPLKNWFLTVLLGLLVATVFLAGKVLAKSDIDYDYGKVDVNDPATQIPVCVKPLLDVYVRDTQVTAGKDGWYYMTGTTAVPGKPELSLWEFNDGIRLWKSNDLKNWEPMGLVWSVDKCKGWQRDYYVYPADPNKPGEVMSPETLAQKHLPDGTISRRACWSAAIRYLPKQDNYFLACSMNHNIHIGKHKRIGHGLWGGTFLLRSITGKPEGPYEDICPDKPLSGEIDADIFEDDDGKVYFIYQDGRIARMKDDLSGLAEKPRLVIQKKYLHEPYLEGVCLTKYKGKYVLSNTIWSAPDIEHGGFHYGPSKKPVSTQAVYAYDAVIALSDSIYGPYGERTTALTGGGHGNYFQDDKGQWWACIFWNPRGQLAKNSKYLCRAALVPMKWKDNQLLPDPNTAETFYN